MATEDPNLKQDALAAEQVRVTPEELTQALARIEARQAEEAKRQEKTISLGQAVEELGLSVAPAEILAEIQARRAQDASWPQQQLAPLKTKPAATPAPQQPLPEIANCPACGRKLLTRASALCSWCGARIDDPAYQAQAIAQRQAIDQNERTQVEAIAQEEAKYGVFGRLKRRAKQGPGPKADLG